MSNTLAPLTTATTMLALPTERDGSRLQGGGTNYQVMPPLSGDDFAALKADIAGRGVLVAVEYDESGNVLDGHHRLTVAK